MPERLYMGLAQLQSVLATGDPLSYHEKWDAALLLKASGCYEEALAVYEHLAALTGDAARYDRFLFESAIGAGRLDRAVELAEDWAAKRGGLRELVIARFLAGDLAGAVTDLDHVEFVAHAAWDGKRIEGYGRESRFNGRFEITLCMLAASIARGSALEEIAIRILRRMGAPEPYLTEEMDLNRCDVSGLHRAAVKLGTPKHVHDAGQPRSVARAIAGGDTRRVQGMMKTVLEFEDVVQSATSQLERYLATGERRDLDDYAITVMGNATKTLCHALINVSSGTDLNGRRHQAPAALTKSKVPSDRLLHLYNLVPLLSEHPRRGRLQVLLEVAGMPDTESVTRMIHWQPIVEREHVGKSKLLEARRILKQAGSPGGGKRAVDAAILKRDPAWLHPILDVWLREAEPTPVEKFVEAWRADRLQDLTELFGLSVMPHGSPENSIEFLSVAEAAMLHLNETWERTMRSVRWKSQEACGKLLDRAWAPIKVRREYAADWLGGLRYDFYIPEEKVAIEYHGAQHFQAVDFFGGAKGLAETQRRDRRKALLSACSGIQLVAIRHDEDMREAVERAYAATR